MTYIKTNWQTGDIITAEKMNHIEEGIAEDIFSRSLENIETVEELGEDDKILVNRNDRMKQISKEMLGN